MSRRIIGPFNRVEGDLEVQLEIAGPTVKQAFVNSTLYRGFEQILNGKDPRDALIYTPRICGICSVSQSSAAAAALRQAQGITPPRNGELVANLILATENIADHLTHFYLFFMPDFARDIYRSEPWFEETEKRFKAIRGEAAKDMLPARAEFMHIAGLLAGKWPHTLTIQPGGSTKSVGKHEKMRLMGLLANFRQFLERHLFGDRLENLTSLNNITELDNWSESHQHKAPDFIRFLTIARHLELESLGKAGSLFLSYGAYQFNHIPAFAAGLCDQGKIRPFNTDDIKEDLSSSWLSHRSEPRHPYDGVTTPDPDATGGYSWCKAPRLDGQVIEVGALARQMVDQQPLITSLIGKGPGNVSARVIARLLEVARIVPLMESWVKEINPGEPFCTHGQLPETGEAAGLIEAARGSLGHWMRIKNGRILNYQIIAPTTWNFSPRDNQGIPGALEQALAGAPIRPGETDPVSVQHIVRSFDPCMVCTVH